METALATHSQDVVTDNEKTAKQAIIYLRENGLGRATFLPLSLINGRIVKDDHDFDGILGIAAELVKCKPTFRSVVDHLLGNVLIADNMDSALDFVRENRGSGFSRIVTLHGEVIMLSGAMTGGSTSSKTVPLLGRQRLMLELKKAIEEGSKDVESLSKTVDDLVKSNEQESDELITLKINAGKLSEYVSQAQLKISAITAAITETSQQVEAKVTEQKETRSKLIDTESNILEKEKLLPEMGEKIHKLLTEEHELLKEKQELQKEIETIESTSRNILENDHNLRERLQNCEVQMARIESDLGLIADRLSTEYDALIEDVLAMETKGSSDQDQQVEKLKRSIKRMEPVNLLAIEEYKSQKERESFMLAQFADLTEAKENLNKLIIELDNLARKEFLDTLKIIGENFQETFSKLFDGGSADIKVLNSENVLESGVEFFVQVPGKKVKEMSSLSGGEKALTAVALIFALLKTKPTPFCILDEVDAALDESNIRKFAEMLSSFALDSQMIIITHNKQTLTACDAIYGVTMQEKGVSKVISVKMK
ncbi:MAG: AAA family ATPase [Candidatus Margulisiibacteriota bacterium]|jgi:chromosome segregation protein